MGTRDGASGAQLARSGRGGRPGGVTRVLRLEWKEQPGTCRRQVLRGRNTRDAVGLPVGGGLAAGDALGFFCS